jgi:predicted deacylase
VANSVNRSAYGHIPIPIAVAKRGKGPTILLTGGVHGDEYEGPLVLSRLMQNLEKLEVAGRIIIVPSVNHPAHLAASRVSPIDEVNLNRCFPGSPDGTITEVIAFYVTSVLLPLADYVIDMHSGGSSLNYLPILFAPIWDDGPKKAETERLVAAFAPPRVAYFNSRYAPDGEDRVFGNVADKNDCHFLTGEFGGGSTVNLDGRAMLERGTYGVLRELGIVRGGGPEAAPAESIKRPETRRLTLDDPGLFAFAPCAGTFEPAFALGDEVAAGALAGRIYDPVAPWTTPREVHFKSGGLAVCLRTFAQVTAGDCLGHLAGEIAG